MAGAHQRGSEVDHPEHGRGVVIDLRHSGFDVLVRFGARERWVRGMELRGKRAASKKKLGATRQAPRTDAQRSALRGLFEAFRLGIVPHAHIADWTFGRDEQTDFVLHWLGDQAVGSLVIEGAYGSGKSHLLEFVYAKSIANGYATAQVGFDPTESPAAFPKRVYRRLVRTIRVPVGDQVLTFREAIRRAAEHPNSKLLSRHQLLGPVLQIVREGQPPERLWEEVEGRRSRAQYLSLYDHTTSANQYCYLLSGLGHLFTTTLGVKGLAMLFDEVETAQTYEYTYQWRRSLNFLRGLSLTANDHPELMDEEVTRSGDAYRGAESKLVYSGHSQVPYLYAMPSFLKVAFAITPGAFTTEFLKWHPDQPVLELQPLRPHAIQELFTSMHQAYEHAYGTSLSPAERNSAFDEISSRTEMQSTRLFIKALVEVLDYRRFHPKSPLRTLWAQDEWSFE